MPNSALEQAASAARPWQRAQRRQCASGGPRPVTRPPLLTAGVRRLSQANRSRCSWRLPEAESITGS